tara:strand:+ start:69626 stop:71077 length:1452 start_codon:yes stop_codon:yes gene_type:complete
MNLIFENIRYLDNKEIDVEMNVLCSDDSGVFFKRRTFKDFFDEWKDYELRQKKRLTIFVASEFLLSSDINSAANDYQEKSSLVRTHHLWHENIFHKIDPFFLDLQEKFFRKFRDGMSSLGFQITTVKPLGLALSWRINQVIIYICNDLITIRYGLNDFFSLRLSQDIDEKDSKKNISTLLSLFGDEKEIVTMSIGEKDNNFLEALVGKNISRSSLRLNLYTPNLEISNKKLKDRLLQKFEYIRIVTFNKFAVRGSIFEELRLPLGFLSIAILFSTISYFFSAGDIKTNQNDTVIGQNDGSKLGDRWFLIKELAQVISDGESIELSYLNLIFDKNLSSLLVEFGFLEDLIISEDKYRKIVGSLKAKSILSENVNISLSKQDSTILQIKLKSVEIVKYKSMPKEEFRAYLLDLAKESQLKLEGVKKQFHIEVKNIILVKMGNQNVDDLSSFLNRLSESRSGWSWKEIRIDRVNKGVVRFEGSLTR